MSNAEAKNGEPLARVDLIAVAAFAVATGYGTFHAVVERYWATKEHSVLLTIAYLGAATSALLAVLATYALGAVLRGRSLPGVARGITWALGLLLLPALLSAARIGKVLPLGLGLACIVVAALLVEGARPVMALATEAAAPAGKGSGRANARGLGIYILPGLSIAVATYVFLMSKGTGTAPFQASASVAAVLVVASLVMRFRIAAWRGFARSAAIFGLLPLAGLCRNPGVLTLVAAIVFACGVHVLQIGLVRGRLPSTWRPQLSRAFRLLDGALPILSVFGAFAFLFVPFAFRELPQVDFKGHEAQHLGWLNSMSFGAFPFADCGLIYGPGREIALYVLAKVLGGLTLEHVRLGHTVLSVAGFMSLVWCVRKVARTSVVFLSVCALLLFHSALISFVIYENTYSFGWSDALRAGLPCMALVLGFQPERASVGRLGTRRLEVSGILTGAATLYSHDFGFLALAAGTLAAFIGGWATVGAQQARLRNGVAQAARFFGGALMVLAIFALVYTAFGRGLRLVSAFRWVMMLAAGKADFAQTPYPVTHATFASLSTLTAKPHFELGLSSLDFVVGPLIPFLAVPLVGLRLARAVRAPESAKGLPLLIALTGFAALTFRHPFMTADVWHLANASAPAMLLLALLLSELPNSFDWKKPRKAGAAAFVSSVAAVAVAVSISSFGTHIPFEHRFERIRSHAEHPSQGPRYVYEDLPRAGDVFVPPTALSEARALRRAVGPGGTLFATTWMLGGGLEAFLVGRPNPTGVDVPHEIVTPAQQEALLQKLKADPPTIIYGSSFNYYGSTVQAFIESHWSLVPGSTVAPIRRYRSH